MHHKQISIIQVGDVHYPELLASRGLADIKDKGLSSSKIDSITSTRIAEITRALQETLVEEANVGGVILCGDITTHGRRDGYSNGLTFLQSALRLDDSAIWKERKLIAIPGNHDIDRRSIVPEEAATKKFESLAALWRNIGFEHSFHYQSPIEVPIESDRDKDGSGLIVLPLNTCFLCGEWRALPSSVRDKLSEALRTYASSVTEGEYLDLLAEQVDCPAIERKHVDAIVKSIRRSQPEMIPIVVGHHPLLPQAVVRVDGYTELLNGGFTRESILSTGKNVIYLHGHIHQDPVHIVSNQVAGQNRIISISAPAVEDGFNVLTFTFSATTKQPLGVEIRPYRFAHHTGIVANPSHTLRLADEGVLWNEADDAWIAYVLGRLSTPRVVLRLQDLIKKLPPRLLKCAADVAKAEILGALRILELLEIVEIRNRRKSSEYWQCQRRVL